MESPSRGLPLNVGNWADVLGSGLQVVLWLHLSLAYKVATWSPLLLDQVSGNPTFPAPKARSLPPGLHRLLPQGLSCWGLPPLPVRPHRPEEWLRLGKQQMLGQQTLGCGGRGVFMPMWGLVEQDRVWTGKLRANICFALVLINISMPAQFQ